MEFWRRLIARGRSHGGDGVRRVIVVLLEGLEPDRVERYLEEGLLHNLALLNDIGARAALDGSPSNTLELLMLAAGKARLSAAVLPPVPITTNVDLHSICAADRAQQEKLIAALSRRRPAVVAAIFDMPLQLRTLFGPQPNPEEQLIQRDVYARMDEVVGKAFSFVNETTALVAVITGRPSLESSNRETAAGCLYVSRPLSTQLHKRTSVSELVMELFGVGL